MNRSHHEPSEFRPFLLHPSTHTNQPLQLIPTGHTQTHTHTHTHKFDEILIKIDSRQCCVRNQISEKQLPAPYCIPTSPAFPSAVLESDLVRTGEAGALSAWRGWFSKKGAGGREQMGVNLLFGCYYTVELARYMDQTLWLSLPLTSTLAFTSTDESHGCQSSRENSR